MKELKSSVVSLIMVSCNLSCCLTNGFDPVDYDPGEPDYWPTISWRVSTPEEQGMDSEALKRMVRFHKRKHVRNEDEGHFSLLPNYAQEMLEAFVRWAL